MILTQRIAGAEVAFKKFRIPHPRVAEVAKQLEILRAVGRETRREWVEGGCRGKRPEQKFLAILARSGSGKSTAVRNYLETTVADEDHPDAVRPVIHVTLSENANTTSAAGDILEELGDPDWEEGTGKKRIKRVAAQLDGLNSEAVIIDEMQHLIHKDTQEKTARSVRDMLKRMLIRGTTPLVFVGTLEAEPVIFGDEQMMNRAMPPVYMPPLDDRDPDERRMWLEHCAGFDIELVRHGIFAQHSNLAFGDIPANVMEIAKGVIGTASRLFEVAAVAALTRGASRIEWDDLDAAVETWAIPLKLVSENPFRRGTSTLKRRKGT